MVLKKWLENWDLTGLKINAGFLELEWCPQVADQNAAWELYVELLTRITTQPLPKDAGDEQTALNSIHSLFATTREIIKRHGKECVQFTKIAVVILNQVIRPFTAKYHKVADYNGMIDTIVSNEFRTELAILQGKLCIYSKMLADMAKVEDLTDLES